jgi:16S rRNA (uracil1498-N3)-methyltransferase
MEVELLDGKGSHFDAVCREVSKSGVVVEVRAVNQSDRLVPEIFMGISFGKGRTLDELIRPLTELGVGGITPLLTERTEARFDAKKWHLRKRKWQKISQEACKQSGHSWLPALSDPLHIKDYFASSVLMETHWMGSLSRGGGGPLLPDGQHRTCHLLIGPEGGWTHKEEEMAGQAGCHFFSLGPSTLRMETAAISALAVARSRLIC